MSWFLACWVLTLQTVFWGLGLTLLILPRRWRRFWPAFVAPAGLALQSAVVWAGAHTALPGTDAYAYPALLLPVGLLAWAWRRLGGKEVAARLADARRWWVLLPVISVSFALQVAPFTKPPARFTVLSLGSCDAADYAAGARVFKEFSSHDRSGFLGQPEQAEGLSVDNFYEFWLRINHFTPSALLALDASLLRRQPYELTSLLGIVLIGLSLPTVFWMARSSFGFRPAGAAAVALIYGCSPVLLYAMGQVALGQLLAAPAVTLILWTTWQADRAASQGQGKRMWSYSGLLLVGNILVLGGYNFFIVFAYVPLAAFVGGHLLWRREGWASAGKLAGFIVVNLLACGVLFPERVIGIAERFLLFNKTPFGWKIAAFRPDGWYGMFGDAYLRAGPGWSLALGMACLLASGAAAWLLIRAGRGRTVALAAACLAPILCGYEILVWEEASGVRKNASYDAYKLFMVFYPVLLPSLCLWLAAGWRRNAAIWARVGTGVLATALFVINLLGGWRYNEILRHGAYAVSPGLSGLSTLDRRSDINGINILVRTVWDILWANQFLLHKTQYFREATYEGRLPTPLQGRWDLEDRYIAMHVPEPEDDPLAANDEFTLVDRNRSDFIEVRLRSGWFEAERFRNTHWSWAAGNPTVSVLNPHPETLDARLRLVLHSEHPRRLRLFAGPTLVWEGQVADGVHAFPAEPLPAIPLRLPPGETLLRFETDGAPDHLPGDSRALTFALYGIDLRPVKPPAGMIAP